MGIFNLGSSRLLKEKGGKLYGYKGNYARYEEMGSSRCN